ncbi:MAG TPA: GDYXXLXY domain-containing protein [Bdellovibrionota bacterium]|nr:GDYXXLXY domain-containing protein [Bdellovibrionota bacterium]
MKKLWIASAIGLQIAVLLGMAAEREYIRETGRIVFLQTLPVDPRDYFRGDYVRLNYEFSQVNKESAHEAFGSEPVKKGTRIYAVLAQNPEGVAEVVRIAKKKPENGLFIAGRISHPWGLRHGFNEMNVLYGIESYYVQQGRGKTIEEKMSPGPIRHSLEVEVALGKNGTAVLRGHRWGPFATELKILESAAPVSAGRPVESNTVRSGRLSPKLRFSIVNVGSEPRALVIPPDLCSLRLVAIRYDGEKVFGPPGECKTGPEDVHLLAPSERKDIEIDLAESRWHVPGAGGQKAEIGASDRLQRYRILYRSPIGAVWQGKLASQPFMPATLID